MIYGFMNWKKVRDGTNCACLSHLGEKKSNSSQIELYKSLEDLMDQSQHIKKVLENFTSKQIANN